MAAGVLVAEEAGGTVTTMDGRAFSGAHAAVAAALHYMEAGAAASAAAWRSGSTAPCQLRPLMPPCCWCA